MIIKGNINSINNFSLSSTIISTDSTTFLLQSDLNIECFGVINYNKTQQKTINFKKTSEGYLGRLKIYEEDLSSLTDKCTMKLCIYNGIKTTTVSIETNIIELTIDIQTISSGIKHSSNKEIAALKAEVKALKDIVFQLQSSKAFTSLPKVDTKYAELGMIPVLATKEGDFILKQPFAHMVESVNNINPIDGNIELSTLNIKHNSQELSEYLLTEKETIKAMLGYIKALQEDLKTTKNTLINTQLELKKHISNPII